MANMNKKTEDSPDRIDFSPDRREKAALEMKERRTKKTRRRRIVMVISVVAALALLVFLFTRGQEDLPRVRTEVVKTGRVVETIGLTPTLQPSRIQSVQGADVPIRQIYVEIGDQVQAGEQLLIYDITDLENELVKTRELIAETEESIETAANEAVDLSSQLGMLSSAQISSQVDAISATLNNSLSSLASQMVDIQTPFLELGQKLNMIDIDGINAWILEMQVITSDLSQRLELLEEAGTLEDLANAIQRLIQLEQDLDALEREVERTRELQEWLESNLSQATSEGTQDTRQVTGQSTTQVTGQSAGQSSEATAGSEETTSETEIPDPGTSNTSSSDYSLANSALNNAISLSFHSSGASPPDLSGLSPEDLQLLQQMLGGSGNMQMLTGGLSQGQDLLEQLQEAEKQQVEIINKLRQPVLADFSGIVVKVDAEKGDTVTAGREIITVYDNQNLKTVTSVGYNDARRLEKGQKVNYSLEDMEFQGEVIFIDPVASNNSSLSPDLSAQMESGFGDISSMMGGMGSLPGVDLSSEPQVKVEMSIVGEGLNKLIIGFTVNAEVETRTKDNVLTLSAFSLLKEKGDYYLYTLEEGNTLLRRDVEIGLESALSVEVISGVEEGDLVVLSPSADLETGQIVDAETAVNDTD